MKTVEKQVRVLTLVPDEGKFLTNYPTASIKDAQISTVVFVREDLAGPWREIDVDEAEEIRTQQAEALKADEQKDE